MFLNAACDQRILNPLGGDNVTKCDPILEPIYNHVSIFNLIQSCVSSEPLLSYAKVVSDHSVSPVVGTADGIRMELLQHLFS